MSGRGLWVIPLLFAALPAAYAQSPGIPQGAGVFEYPLSAAALPRYTALCAELAAHPVIKGSFEQTKTIARLNRSVTSTGVFIIAADLGMVWDTRSPFPSTLAMGRDFMVQSTPGGTKSKIDAQGNETFMNLAETISAIFTGNARMLRERFDNYFMESGGEWTIGLVPREAAVRAFAGRIILSGAAAGPGEKPAVIRTIVIEEQTGGGVRYTLSNHRFPPALQPDEQQLFFLE